MEGKKINKSIELCVLISPSLRRHAVYIHRFRTIEQRLSNSIKFIWLCTFIEKKVGRESNFLRSVFVKFVFQYFNINVILAKRIKIDVHVHVYTCSDFNLFVPSSFPIW